MFHESLQRYFNAFRAFQGVSAVFRKSLTDVLTRFKSFHCVSGGFRRSSRAFVDSQVSFTRNSVGFITFQGISRCFRVFQEAPGSFRGGLGSFKDSQESLRAVSGGRVIQGVSGGSSGMLGIFTSSQVRCRGF